MRKKKGSTYRKLNQENTKRLGEIAKTSLSFYFKYHAFVASAILSVKNVLFAVSQQQHRLSSRAIHAQNRMHAIITHGL
jgi:hypothetical protein